MNEDNFDDVLNDLHNKISQFDNKTSNENHFSFLKNLKKINIKSPLVYTIIIFFTLCIVLIILKHNFIMYDIQDNQGNVTTKISYTKTVLISLILSIIFTVLHYYYFRER